MSEHAQLPIMLIMEPVLHALRDVPFVPMPILAPLALLDCTSKVLFVKSHVMMDTSTLVEFARDAHKDVQPALHMINVPHVLMDSSWLELNVNLDVLVENTSTTELAMPAILPVLHAPMKPHV